MGGKRWEEEEIEDLIKLIEEDAILNNPDSSETDADNAWFRIYKNYIAVHEYRSPRGFRLQVEKMIKNEIIPGNIKCLSASAEKKMDALPKPDENHPSNDRNTESSTTDELASLVPASYTPNNTNTDVAMAELNKTFLKLAQEVKNMRVKMNKLETKQEKMDNFLSSYGNTGPIADDQPTTPDSEAGQTDEDDDHEIPEISRSLRSLSRPQDDQRNTERNNGQTAPDSSLAATTENYQLITYGGDAGQPAANDSETYDGADDVTCAEFSRKTQLEVKYESNERTRYTKRK